MTSIGYTAEEALPLHPPVHVTEVRHLHDYVCEKKGKSLFRKIYFNVPYDPIEEEQIARFEKMVAERGLTYPADWERADSLKLIYNADLDIKKAIPMTEEHFKWRKREIPLERITIDVMVRIYLICRTHHSSLPMARTSSSAQ